MSSISPTHIVRSSRLGLITTLQNLLPLSSIEILQNIGMILLNLPSFIIPIIEPLLIDTEFIEPVQQIIAFSQYWHINRIDQRQLPLTENVFDRKGTGAKIYILDTGVSPHSEFGDRLLQGRNFSDNRSFLDKLFSRPIDYTNTLDKQGHGTHVASLAAGITTGSSNAFIIPIKVLNDQGSGTTATILQGINYILSQDKGIVNASLGGSVSQALDDGFLKLVQNGYVTVVASGNENQLASNSSPGRVPELITVGSSTINDVRSSFSNYGPSVDIYAPGENITAAWLNNDYATISGTSMASPLVAGVLTYKTTNELLSSATTGTLSQLRGCPNLLLYSNTI